MLTEMHHAFIAGTYYEMLKDVYGENGKETFSFAVRRYAEERGARMAQRALRDGYPLDLHSYAAYGEWDYTSSGVIDHEFLSEYPSLHYTVSKCPWYTQFMKMDMPEAAKAYCADLDYSLVRGFNPAMPFVTKRLLCRDGQCEFILNGSGIGADIPQKEQNKRGFAYHCAHLFAVFARVLKNVYGSDGDTISASVMHRFHDEYGAEAARLLQKYVEHCDFSDIDDGAYGKDGTAERK